MGAKIGIHMYYGNATTMLKSRQHKKTRPRFLHNSAGKSNSKNFEFLDNGLIREKGSKSRRRVEI